MIINDGQIFYINFKGNVGKEINDVHLGLVYKLPLLKEVVFCIPLTSPKLKHFKTDNDFLNRNYKNIKHFNWQYIKQTDSIALLDQIKIISTERLLSPYLINKIKVILNENTQQLLKAKIIKYFKIILYKEMFIF